MAARLLALLDSVDDALLISARRRRKIADYLLHLAAHCPYPPDLVEPALTYVARLREVPGCQLTSENVQAVFVAACMLAEKFLCDRPHSTAHWASLSRYSAVQLLRMESTFVSLIKWDLSVDDPQAVPAQPRRRPMLLPSDESPESPLDATPDTSA